MDKHYCNIWTPTGPKEQWEQEWLEKRKSLLTASDVSTALGHNQYKTPVDLWQEKLGMKAPADLSNNPAVLYGKENEPRIRAEFAKENESWCDVDYHQYDIFISKEKPFLGATLDGEIKVTSDENPYAEQGVRAGEELVLEIKTGGFYSAQDLEERWGQCPLGYVEQVRTQMFCTGSKHEILRAELTYKGDKDKQGELADKYIKDYFFKFDRAQEELIVDGCTEFWKAVTSGKCPSLDVSDEATASDELLAVAEPTPDNLLEVKLEADAEIGKFMDNFDVVEKAVIQMVAPYKGMVLTANDVKNAKAIKANLNTKITAIKQTRIAVKKKYCAPLTVFEDRAKSLEKILADAIAPLSAQLAYFDEQEKEAKKKKTLNLCCNLGGEFFVSSKDFDWWYNRFFLPEFDDAWLNKSTSMKKIQADIEARMQTYKTNVDLIARHAGEDEVLLSNMMYAYAESRDIGKAFAAEDSYREMQSIRLEREQRAAEAKAAAERAKAEAEAVAQPELKLEPVPEPPRESPATIQKIKEPKQIIFTFKAAHTSVAEWKGLLTYMKEHGFKFTQTKN